MKGRTIEDIKQLKIKTKEGETIDTRNDWRLETIETRNKSNWG